MIGEWGLVIGEQGTGDMTYVYIPPCLPCLPCPLVFRRTLAARYASRGAIASLKGLSATASISGIRIAEFKTAFH